ncbi:MAG: metal-chelation protein CHAD [Pseudonocardiales bacterium]|nr:CHAD domain-containing protein [Actinomycetota bacterium]PZS11862.1 MAG: metal-chelation protein CHAD [Pseudonocardiales bacterium]
MSAVTHGHHGGPLRPGKLVKLGDPVRSRPSDPTVHQLRAALDTRLRALLAHDPGTRVGEDPEELHQMRVAVRRMRATLKAARPLLDRVWADDLRAELGWLGRALGPVRDADVLIERLRGRAAAFDDTSRLAVETLIEALVTDRETARAEMLAVLGSRRYTVLLRRLATAVSRPLPASSGRLAAPSLVELVRAEYRRLSKAVRAAGEDPPDEVLHALRIQGKRLRYTGELVATSGRKRERTPVRELVESTVALQDVLGEHQDACVAQHRVMLLLDGLGDVGDVGVAFVAGRLVEREEISRMAMRQSWSTAWQQVQHRAQSLQPTS